MDKMMKNIFDSLCTNIIFNKCKYINRERERKKYD